MANVWWIVVRDLQAEWRSGNVWPAMLLLGSVVAFVFGLVFDLPAENRSHILGALLWLAIFFAGTLVLDRSFSAEREDGGLDGLLLLPIAPSTIYVAKLLFNIAALICLQCVLIPLFVVLLDASLLDHLGSMVPVTLLGTAGICAVGTLLSAVTSGNRSRAALLQLLVLPTVLPVVLGASEATAHVIDGNSGAVYWRSIQLLLAFDILFITAGILLFEYVIEE